MNNRTSNAKVKRFKDRSILVFKRSKDCKFWIGALLSCTLLLIYVYIKTHGERERGGGGVISLYHYFTYNKSLHCWYTEQFTTPHHCHTWSKIFEVFTKLLHVLYMYLHILFHPWRCTDQQCKSLRHKHTQTTEVTTNHDIVDTHSNATQMLLHIVKI